MKIKLYTTQGSSVSLPGERVLAWADNMSDALDNLVDADLGGAIVLDEKDVSPENEDHIARLGNNGTPCDLSDVVVESVDLSNINKNIELMLKLAEARGAGHDNLDF